MGRSGEGGGQLAKAVFVNTVLTFAGTAGLERLILKGPKTSAISSSLTTASVAASITGAHALSLTIGTSLTASATERPPTTTTALDSVRMARFPSAQPSSVCASFFRNSSIFHQAPCRFDRDRPAAGGDLFSGHRAVLLFAGIHQNDALGGLNLAPGRAPK